MRFPGKERPTQVAAPSSPSPGQTWPHSRLAAPPAPGAAAADLPRRTGTVGPGTEKHSQQMHDGDAWLLEKIMYFL